jgi:hypothetical protein
LNASGEPYDAMGRRKGQDLYYILGGSKVAPGGAKPAAVGAKTYQPSKIGGSKAPTVKSTAPVKTFATGAAAKKSTGSTAGSGADSEHVK